MIDPSAEIRSIAGGAKALLLSASLAALVFIAPSQALAEGALAIGLPADAAKDGVAFGYSYGYSTEAEAKLAALEKCLATTEPPPATRALCKVIETFKNKCVSISMDPNAGMAGTGWAIAQTRQIAQNDALYRCQSTSTEDRKGYCVTSAIECDGTAN